MSPPAPAHLGAVALDDLTPAQLHACIPARCRERSAARSLGFVVRDGVFLAAVTAAMLGVLPYVEGSVLAAPLWCLYAIVQGTVATGWWVIAHECGHGAFSRSTALNDAVGFVLHSVLLVPYFSWQFSHAKHHKYTNHLTKGETHVPSLRKGGDVAALARIRKVIGDDAFALFHLTMQLGIGWPMYLILNSTGGRENYKGERIDRRRPISHYVASKSELFPPSFHWRVRASAAGIAAVLGALGLLAWEHGAGTVACWYGGPYLVVNAWLVFYTWMQHTHPDMPHYGNDTHTFVKGALSTVDRPYPWIADELHHHIGTTHVLHHINYSVPHYHAQEATASLKAALGQHYRYDPRPVHIAAVQTQKACVCVEGVTGVQYWESFAGRSKALKEEKAQQAQQGKVQQPEAQDSIRARDNKARRPRSP